MAPSVFQVSVRSRAFTLSPPPPLSPSLIGHLASADAKQNVYLLTKADHDADLRHYMSEINDNEVHVRSLLSHLQCSHCPHPWVPY